MSKTLKKTARPSRDGGRPAPAAARHPVAAGGTTTAFAPAERLHYEMIGGKEYVFKEEKIPVEDVVLWHANPRTKHLLPDDALLDEDQLAEKLGLESASSYNQLRKDIESQGQMNPVYVWKKPGMRKYLVVEGNTRVAVMRELKARHAGKSRDGEFDYIIAKVAPPNFDEEALTLLLLTIHVRGPGTRDWNRYAQSREVYDAVTPQAGQPRRTTPKKLAEALNRSESWVTRLVQAYRFAQQYVDFYNNSADAKREMVDKFSILEEISRTSTFGTKVRTDDPQYDPLREDVFKMVNSGVFTEYRDARYMQEFHENAEMWAELKQNQPGAAKRLATEISANSSTLGTRILGLPDAIKRLLNTKPDALSDAHVDALQSAYVTLYGAVEQVGQFRYHLNTFRKSLDDVKLAEVKQVSAAEWDELLEQLTELRGMAGRRVSHA